jgi:hypothetical protein
MKGQAVSILAIALIFIIVKTFTRRDWTAVWRGPGLLLAFPLAEFFSYTVYFHSQGQPWWYLARVYSRVVRNPFVMQSLNAFMPNLWYAVAYHLKKGPDPIWSVTGPYHLHTIASVFTIFLFAAFAILVAKRHSPQSPCSELFYLCAWSTLIFPMILTRIHENYFFMGSIFSISLLVLIPSRRFRLAMHTLLAIQFINLFCLYGVGDNAISHSTAAQWLQHLYSEPVRYLSSYISMTLILVVCYYMVRWTRSEVDPRLTDNPWSSQQGKSAGEGNSM